MSLLEFRNISRAYRGKPALEDVSFGVDGDSLTVICGPPQSGKSVLLRLLVGLEQPDAGEILLGGRRLDRMPTGERPVGYVPQSFALFPQFSVYDNIAYPLRLEGTDAAEIRRRVDHVAGLVNVRALLDKTPDQLSGGEKQRTAVARGLLKDAEVFVLDDPLVGLDFKLRERLMEDLRDMREQLGIAFVYATGDPLEALTMADRLVVIDAGRVVEHRPVAELYHEPRRLRSAELVGFPPCNLMPVTVEESGLCRGEVVEFRMPAGAKPGPAIAAVRPEDVRLGADDLGFEAEVRLVEDLGAELIVYLSAGGTDLTVVLRADAGEPPREGDTATLAIAPDRLMVFDAASGERLGRGEGMAHG